MKDLLPEKAKANTTNTVQKCPAKKTRQNYFSPHRTPAAPQGLVSYRGLMSSDKNKEPKSLFPLIHSIQVGQKFPFI